MPTLDGAIKELENMRLAGMLTGYMSQDDAVKLGLEGLKREKANRENPDFVMVGKLPGETEE